MKNPDKLLTRPDLAEPHRLFAKACRMSRRWSSYVGYRIRKNGDVTGTHTSGCYNPDWPEHVKDRLRKLAHAIGPATDAAYAARPRRVQFRTMRWLANAVARRDGSGYYGPRA